MTEGCGLDTHEWIDAGAVEQMLSSGDVAAIFGVDSGTVVRWTRAGKISSARTAGGHRRYRWNDVRNLVRALEVPGPTAAYRP